MGLILLSIWLILYGLVLAGALTVSNVFVGIFAVIVGVVLLIEGVGVTVVKRP